MLYYVLWIDITEGSALLKVIEVRMYDLPLSVFNRWFKLQDSVCNGYHDLTLLSVNISNIAIITIKNFDY